MNKKLKLFPNLKSFIENYENNIVHFTTCNSGGVKLAKNLSKSCQINNIDLAFFAPDQNALEEMSRHTTTINNIANNKFRLDICREIPVDHTIFGSKDFISVAWMRYEILKAIINSGRIAIYLDTDIVVRRNYEEDILSYLQPNIGNEGVIQQNNEGFLCT